MTDSLLAQLSSIVKPATMAEIATHLGVPEQSATRGVALSAGTAFAALANKAGDPDAMRQVIETASRTPVDAIASGVSAGQLADPTSSLMSTGRNFLSSLFGGRTSWVADLIGREVGLGSGATSTVMALGANALLSFIGRRVRSDGLTGSSLASLLSNEAPGLRKMMPAAFGDAFATHSTESGRTLDTTPVVAQTVRKERSSWAPWLTAAAILLAGTWLWHGLHRPRFVPVVVPVAVPATRTVGTSGVIATTPIERFNFDRMLFDTGSARLRPEANAQLRSAAEMLKAHPNTNVKIEGFTDNVGSAAANLKLSQERANSVRNALIAMGVAPDRLTAEGSGEANPVGDNTTAAGRAMNRRITMEVTQK